MLTELVLCDACVLFKWAGAVLVLMGTVWWARKHMAAPERSVEPALACGDTFEQGVSFASVLDIPELRQLIAHHHDGDCERADPTTHSLSDAMGAFDGTGSIQVVFSGAGKLSQVVKGWTCNPSEARFLVHGRNTMYEPAAARYVRNELTAGEALVYLQQQDGEYPPIALDLSDIQDGYMPGFDIATSSLVPPQPLATSGLSNEEMLSIFSARPHLQHFEVRNCDWITGSQMLRDLAAHCTELRFLFIDPEDMCPLYCAHDSEERCPQCTPLFTADSLRVLAQSCTQLRFLHLYECNFGDAEAQVLAESCRGLRVLNLARGYDGLELKVGDLGVCAIAESCCQLESLDLDTSRLTDVALLALARGCPQLKRLTVKFWVEGGAYSMTNAAVEALVQNCSQLETVELPGYWLILEESCPRLQATLQLFTGLKAMHMCKGQKDHPSYRASYSDECWPSYCDECCLCERREPTGFPTETGHPFNSSQGQDGRGVFERGPPWHRYVKLTAGLTGSALFQSSRHSAQEHDCRERTTLSFTR